MPFLSLPSWVLALRQGAGARTERVLDSRFAEPLVSVAGRFWGGREAVLAAWGTFSGTFN